MKNLICLISACLFVGSALLAQEGTIISKRGIKIKDNNYCVMLRDDNMLVVRKAGKAIEDNVKLANGAIINIDGTVTQKNGNLILINLGECVDNSGNLVTIKDFSVVKEAYRM